MADDMFNKALPLLTRTADLLEKRTQLDQELLEGFRYASRLAAKTDETLKDVRRYLDRMDR
jgi:hypothetical protein